MTAVILLLTLGGWLIYSALKGQSLAESLTGNTSGDSLDPTGGSTTTTTSPGDLTGHPDNPLLDGSPFTGKSKYGFKGPNVALLERLTDTAVQKYHLSVSQVCRPQDATYGAPNSLHKQCRAVDLTGSVANRVAFARYAKGVSGVAEVFCDQAGFTAPGYQHSDHVHIGA